jgi:ribosomal-protein-alanine N-acetyltransferase
MKIELRKLRIFDTEELTKAINNKEIIPYLDSNRKYPISLDYAKKSIIKSIKDKKNYKKAIIVDGKFIGTISLYNPNKNKKIFEIGYFIARPYWNKGIATKAVKEMCNFGFKKLKLKRIWADTQSNNPASARVLEKAGFKLEGRKRKSIYKKGKYFDELIFGRLR